MHGRTQFVKLGQYRSSEATMEVGVPQGSVLGPLLFAVYCSPVANIIDSHVRQVLALDLEGVHDLKLHHPSSSVATSNQ